MNKPEMRIRLSTIALALWGFGLNIALQKGWLDAVPNWIVALMLAVPICVWVFVSLTHNRFKNYLHRTNRHVAMIVFVVVGAVLGGAIGGVIYALSQRSVASNPKDSSKPTWAIDYEQETKMLGILQNSPKSPVMVTWTKGDKQGRGYAIRLIQVLTKAGLQVGQRVFDDSWMIPAGINLWWIKNDTNNRQVAKLRSAITETNMECGEAPRHAIPKDTTDFEINIMVKSGRDFESGNTLSEMTNEQFREATMRFVGKLRQFNSDFRRTDEQRSVQEWSELSEIINKMPDQEKPETQNRITEIRNQVMAQHMARTGQFEDAYRANYLIDAQLFDTELRKRSNIKALITDPGSGAIKKGRIIALDGKLAGPDPVLDLANYLESLAKQLPPNG